MVDIILQLGIGIINIIIIVLGLAVIIQTYRVNKKVSNPFGYALLLVLIANIGVLFIRLFEISYLYGNPNAQPLTLGVNLKLNYIVPLIIGICGLLYVIFLYDIKEIYTLPLIIGFYFSLMLYLYELILPLLIYVLVVYSVNSLILLVNGIKKSNGDTVALGLFYIVGLLFEWLSYIFLENIFIILEALLSVIILNLGAWGIINTYIFKDRETMRGIKETWISTVVSISDDIIITKVTAKRLKIRCPICNIEKVQEFSPAKVEERKNNKKGIVQMLIDKNVVCEHTFIIYLDRQFAIRGYASLDYMI